MQNPNLFRKVLMIFFDRKIEAMISYEPNKDSENGGKRNRHVAF